MRACVNRMTLWPLRDSSRFSTWFAHIEPNRQWIQPVERVKRHKPPYGRSPVLGEHASALAYWC